MIRQTKYKSIILIIISLIFFSLDGKSQPGYPANGFVIFFNTDFIDFPDSLKSEHTRARYLDTTFTILFVDSTKTIGNDTSLRFKCSYRILSVDTNDVAKLIVHIGSSYGLGECYDDNYIIKDLSLSSQSKATIYWYTGKLIFIYEGVIKEFFIKNIPDGCAIDLGNIKFDRPNEFIVFPPSMGKMEIEDLNEYRKE